MRSRYLEMVMLGLLGLGLGGCMSRTMAEDSVADHYPLPDDELDFWDSMETRRVVTNNDALHGLLLIDGSGGDHATYESRLGEASARGWVTRADLPSDESVRLGVVSVAICDMLEVKGGLTMQLVGPHPRYCTRELIYMGLLPDRTEDQSLSGLEFMDLIRKIGDRLQGKTDDMLERAIEETLEAPQDGTDEESATNEETAGGASASSDAPGEGS